MQVSNANILSSGTALRPCACQCRVTVVKNGAHQVLFGEQFLFRGVRRQIQDLTDFEQLLAQIK